MALAPIILGTAGHLDHGKSSLIKRLTGIDPDRLKEEKLRGITIELGFAYLTLPTGQLLGIVDVPGHERFVRHMVGGARGMYLVRFSAVTGEGKENLLLTLGELAAQVPPKPTSGIFRLPVDRVFTIKGFGTV